MNEENYQEAKAQCEQMKEKTAEMQEKIIEGINKTMNSTAETLDVAADKIHEASSFFKNRNADTIKGDVTDLVKKYPAQTLLGSMIVGFLFGRVLSR